MTPPHRRAPRDVSRRTWIEWLGQATVFSLSAYMLGCGDEGSGQVAPGGGGAGGAGGAGGTAGTAGSGAGGAAGTGADAGADAPLIEGGTTPACPDGTTPPFQFSAPPNTGPLFDSWPVRTIDQQQIDSILATWKLRVDGMVETPLELSFYDMLCLPRQDQIVDFHCVEGWTIRDVPWNGLHISSLLDAVKPLSTATHITFHTIGNKYNESLPIDVALEPKTLLAYGVDGSSLPLARGFPARLVVPRLFGYKSAKYVERIELTDEPIEGYWVAAGYGYDAEVPPERLRPGKY